MGSRVAPPLAIVFMHALETMFLASPRLQPSLYLRYIDDMFGVWTGGRREPDRSSSSPVYLTLPFVDDDLCRRTEGIVRGS